MANPRKFHIVYADGMIQEVYATSKRRATDQATHGADIEEVQDVAELQEKRRNWEVER